MLVWVILILVLLSQGMIMFGLLGIFISAFSDSFRDRLRVFVTLLFAGVILYLTVSWTVAIYVIEHCPGGVC